MGKPLLTDDIIAQAQEEENWNKHANLEAEVTDPSVHKSRRIENAKRGAFQSKLNQILFIIIVLIAILIYAIFNL